MPAIEHLLNWGPDTPYCQTKITYEPGDFTSEDERLSFLSLAAVEALEMKEQYINAGLGIAPGGMVAEAERLGATVIASKATESPVTAPSLPSAPSAPTQGLRRGELPFQGATWSGVQHAGCGFEMAFKPSWFNKKSGKQVGASLQCTGGCKNEKGYAASEWVKDEDLHLFTNQPY